MASGEDYAAHARPGAPRGRRSRRPPQRLRGGSCATPRGRRGRGARRRRRARSGGGCRARRGGSSARHGGGCPARRGGGCPARRGGGPPARRGGGSPVRHGGSSARVRHAPREKSREERRVSSSFPGETNEERDLTKIPRER
jgi:hypothetical protein